MVGGTGDIDSELSLRYNRIVATLLLRLFGVKLEKNVVIRP